MVSSKCCQVESPSPFRFFAALIPPCAQTECDRFTGTIENRSTLAPISAHLIAAERPARPPPTMMILGLAIAMNPGGHSPADVLGAYSLGTPVRVCSVWNHSGFGFGSKFHCGLGFLNANADWIPITISPSAIATATTWTFLRPLSPVTTPHFAQNRNIPYPKCHAAVTTPTMYA